MHFAQKKKNGKIFFFLHRLLQDVEDTTGSDTPGWIRVLMSITPNYDQIIYNVAAQNK